MLPTLQSNGSCWTQWCLLHNVKVREIAPGFFAGSKKVSKIIHNLKIMQLFFIFWTSFHVQILVDTKQSCLAFRVRPYHPGVQAWLFSISQPPVRLPFPPGCACRLSRHCASFRNPASSRHDLLGFATTSYQCSWQFAVFFVIQILQVYRTLNTRVASNSDQGKNSDNGGQGLVVVHKQHVDQRAIVLNVLESDLKLLIFFLSLVTLVSLS